MIYYKVHVICLSTDDDGEIVSEWDETESKHFETTDEAIKYIKDNYDFKNGEWLEDDFELWDTEVEEGKSYNVSRAISIVEYNVKNMSLYKLTNNGVDLK